jgi:hypothetical protein
MIVLDAQKICFVCVPKNGTHTLYGHLQNFGGRRIGRYHEFNDKLIPRYRLGLKRYKTIMIWRDPVERAISLFKDIVVREQEQQRLVNHPDSILRHELIASLCPDFSKFSDFLCYSSNFCEDYLFKNQSWWAEQCNPAQVINIEVLSDFLFDITGSRPEKMHSTSSLNTSVTPSAAEEDVIKKVWAFEDYRLQIR